jgi:hypothetical protein
MGKTRVDKAVCTNSPPELTNQLLLILRIFSLAYIQKQKSLLQSWTYAKEKTVIVLIHTVSTQKRNVDIHTVCTQNYV